jgi:hypothetical protein
MTFLRQGLDATEKYRARSRLTELIALFNDALNAALRRSR